MDEDNGSQMNKRLFIVFLLGFSSGLPLALVSSTLQAWFAESGMSVMITGALSLISFPYVYRFFWAPLLDRYSLCRLGRRRSWIIFMQICLLSGFNVLAWMTPEQSPVLMAVIAFILACCSATQDVAIEAHRTEYLPVKEYGLGASLAVFGYRIALLLSGGLALIIADYYGWPCTYRTMGFLMGMGMLAIIMSSEPSRITEKPSSLIQNFVLPIKELWWRQGIIALLLFIFFFKAGEAFTSTTSGIVMPFLIQGLGFSVGTIGFVNKIIGIISVLIGGLLAGLILMRCSLYRSLMIFGLLQALTNVTFVILAMSGKNFSLLILAVVSDNFATGMGTTALVVFLMRQVNQKYTGTQLSILVAFSSLPRILSGPFAASVQMYIGWVNLYELSVVIALLFIPFLLRIRKQIEEFETMDSKYPEHKSQETLKAYSNPQR
ncbi:beta lactamase induction signal transducer AmpG [Legionella israelensis]|uniref:Beta lactamase induction signal transducer AmpG n=2 Tax=Legionella israelensis TaxID=454 RepID=A0A0W0VTB2_9GAMM|nr:beta lactamase induction signal transducer AmpG [Legionella israelensis]SCY48146.1 MFS transporter, PAT family, beta-lactamase induction signal transducer AmpG [Legionella israelensis DSM 19235]STX58420.1 beta lactamase induction signal transducer AmpG [Legionella israelensis]